MLVQPHEIQELTKCFLCDCETADLCTWHGEPCKECFDIKTYQHKIPDRDHPGLFKTDSRASVMNTRQISYPRIEEIQTDPNGDCLYDCISRALGGKISIENLRAFVARSQTPDTYAAYRTVSRPSDEAGEGGYAVLHKVRTLRGLKNTIQRCGKQVGAADCLWGDENALHIISNAYNIRFAVFDTRGNLIQQVIPDNTPSIKTILLRLNRRVQGSEHFTLLSFNRQTLLEQHEWNFLTNKN